MNCVNLIGRLARDPELRYAQNGTAICKFTVACDRRLSKQKKAEAEAAGQQTADFIGCTAFGQTAELIANYHRKGSQIGIEGRIQTGSYERDGQRVYTTDVIVNNLTFISGGQNQNQGGFNQGGFNQSVFNQGGFNQSQNVNQNQGQPVNSAYNNDEFSSTDDDNAGFFPIDNDDIPF